MREVTNYYTTLYTSQNIDNTIIQQCLNSIQCEKISSEHKYLCDDFISVDEVQTTIKERRKGKSKFEMAPRRNFIRNSTVRWHQF